MDFSRLRGRALLAAAAVVAGLAIVVPGAGPAAGATVETRDPLTWPFARDSIWNTPIGSRAAYVPARLQAANAWYGRITADPEFISVDPADPVRTLRAPGQAGDGAKVKVAADLTHDGGWNGCSTVLTADNRSVWSGQPLKVAPGGDPSWTWTTQGAPIDLKGAGVEGCHGGSRLSGIGGSLRVGELDSSAPLRHALKVNLNCKKYCFRGATQSGSKRWPALTADAYWASGYAGTVPALKMGALLALPPSVDVTALRDPKARKIAQAFRDYGAYVVDDTAWDVHALNMDQRMVESGEFPTSSATFHSELQQVFQQLAVVDNNAAAAVGGGGTPRARLAPCFTGDLACLDADGTAPAPAPAPAPTVPPAPAAPTAQPVPTAAPTTPAPTTTAPTTAPAPAQPISPLLADLEPSSVVDGFEQLSNSSLRKHAGLSSTYDVAGRYAHLTSDLVVDASAGRGSVVFEVWADDRNIFTSARVTAGATAQLSVSVSGATSLRLVVRDSGSGQAYGSARWAGGRLWSAR